MMESALADGDDPNAELCVDPILRADVANALGKVTDNSCKVCSTDLQFRESIAIY